MQKLTQTVLIRSLIDDSLIVRKNHTLKIIKINHFLFPYNYNYTNFLCPWNRSLILTTTRFSITRSLRLIARLPLAILHWTPIVRPPCGAQKIAGLCRNVISKVRGEPADGDVRQVRHALARLCLGRVGVPILRLKVAVRHWREVVEDADVEVVHAGGPLLYIHDGVRGVFVEKSITGGNCNLRGPSVCGVETWWVGQVSFYSYIDGKSTSRWIVVIALLWLQTISTNKKAASNLTHLLVERTSLTWSHWLETRLPMIQSCTLGRK